MGGKGSVDFIFSFDVGGFFFLGLGLGSFFGFGFGFIFLVRGAKARSDLRKMGSIIFFMMTQVWLTTAFVVRILYYHTSTRPPDV